MLPVQESLFDAKDIYSLVENLDRFVEPPIVEFKSEKLLNNADEMLRDLCAKYYELMTAEPFAHESLLLDHKETKLSESDKRLAHQDYLQAKNTQQMYARARASVYNYGNYTSGSATWGNNAMSSAMSKINSALAVLTGGSSTPHPVAPLPTTPLSNGFGHPYSVIRPRPPPPLVDLDAIKLKLTSRGFTLSKDIVLSQSLMLQDKSSSNTTLIQSGETVKIYCRPSTRDNIMVTNDGKIVEAQPGLLESLMNRRNLPPPPPRAIPGQSLLMPSHSGHNYPRLQVRSC